MFSFLSGLNPQALAIKALAALVAAAAIFASGFYVAHRMDASTLATLKLGYAQAQDKAVTDAAAIQARQDASAESDALAEAQAQQKIVVRTITLKEKVPVYVQDNAHCITFGLVRVLNAAAFGRDPAAQPPAAGQPDDACAPVSWRTFAADLADDYGTGRANAEQLNALEASVRTLNHDATQP